METHNAAPITLHVVNRRCFICPAPASSNSHEAGCSNGFRSGWSSQWITPARLHAAASADESEERSHLVDERGRLLERGEVAALVERVEPAQIFEARLRPPA